MTGGMTTDARRREAARAILGAPARRRGAKVNLAPLSGCRRGSAPIPRAEPSRFPREGPRRKPMSLRKSLSAPAAALALASLAPASGSAKTTAPASQSRPERPSHIEGRLAFLKTELKITDAQSAQWNALAGLMRQ